MNENYGNYKNPNLTKRKNNNNIDIVIIIMSLIIGIFIGYLIGNKLNTNNTIEEKTDPVSGTVEDNLPYIYLLQIAKFDNPDGANKYYETLKSKNLDSIIVYDNVYYYLYGGISATEVALENLKNKFYIMGYNTIIKKDLLIEKANMIIDEEKNYEFFKEAINNLYSSLKDEPYTISEKYYVDPINLELFTQLTILINLKNPEIKQKAQLQAYKIIIENL